MSLLEQDTTKKKEVEKILKWDTGKNDSKEYKKEAIWVSKVYANKWKLDHLLGFYYLVAWNGYLEEENIWKSASTI